MNLNVSVVDLEAWHFALANDIIRRKAAIHEALVSFTHVVVHFCEVKMTEAFPRNACVCLPHCTAFNDINFEHTV